MRMETAKYHLFECVGIELEYMIVNRNDLNVMPIADRLLAAEAGEITTDLERGDIAWSNELVLHVIELKTNGPVRTLAGVSKRFQDNIARINELLADFGGCLMPTAAHPWMDPLTETRLWPHQYSPIYAAYNRIFGCRGHGWSNLQSVHINLPFANDAEFGRLHAAIRLVLPIIPALTAASPILDGAAAGYLDARMQVYGTNSVKIPSIAGKIIPERAFSQKQYTERIFAPMYADIAPHDPDGILQHEFLNSRGAIARFDRGAIEIRVVDLQECPRADLAAAGLIVACLTRLAGQRWAPLAEQMAWEVDPLASIYQETIRSAGEAVIENPAYLGLFGVNGRRMTAMDLWRHIRADCLAEGPDPGCEQALSHMLKRGPLAGRILQALNGDLRPESVKAVYARLCRCLRDDALFLA
jgi:carboxylate-amine ligase